MDKFVFKSLRGLFGLAICGILVLIIFLSNIEYTFKKDFVASNLTMFLIFVVFLLALGVVSSVLRKKNIVLIKRIKKYYFKYLIEVILQLDI